MSIDLSKLKHVLVTDCGSTTTKALLFLRTDQGWRLFSRGEAPTTVENPIADVTVGARNAFQEVAELTALDIFDPKNPEELNYAENGIDLYLSSSSAGGGLQMLLAGLVKDITAASGSRAALGAGAIVLDTLSLDDGYTDFERIEVIRDLKPDIFLLAGGFDGGAKEGIMELAESLLLAAPKPRFGNTLKLPVLYAGNVDCQEAVSELLESIAVVSCVENVRPGMSRENIEPARDKIHDLFLEHVMSHSPGYDRLSSWTARPIMPTPSAVGNIMQAYAKETEQNVLAVDIGGATTDVFSVFKAQDEYHFNRTVSANLGMSYSISNVLYQAGVDNILRWLPEDFKAEDLVNRIRNKMIRPTSIPQTKEDLALEQAVCREALRLSLEHHQELASSVDQSAGVSGIAAIFAQQTTDLDLFNMLNLDLVIGSGGVISHAPTRMQSALMLLDGFQLEGFTAITVDSVFMLPHLGVFADVAYEYAQEILEHDCLINVAHALVPVASNPRRIKNKVLAIVDFAGSQFEVVSGELEVVPLVVDQEYEITITPKHRRIDVGGGVGEVLKKKFIAGSEGLILDGRRFR